MNQQIIVLCGPDMTGKTQIAKELSRRLGVSYFKASSEHQTYLKEKDAFRQQLRYADPRTIDILRQTGLSLVMDRGFPCEFSYSLALKRETDFAMLRVVDSEYALLGTRVIICHRTSYDNIVDDIDPTLNSNKLQEIHNAYKMFARWTQCRTMMLPVDDENLDREVNDVVSWLQVL